MRLGWLPRGPTLHLSSFASTLPPPTPQSAEDWSQSSESILPGQDVPLETLV